MMLTETPINRVLSSGVAAHTEIGWRVIEAVRQECGIEVAAMYCVNAEEGLYAFYLRADGAPVPSETDALKPILTSVAASVIGNTDEALAASVKVTSIEIIEEILLCRYLSDAVHKLTNDSRLSAIGAKAFCGFDDKGSAECVVLLPHDVYRTEDRKTLGEYCADALYRTIRARDVFGFVTEELLLPRFLDARHVSGEDMFSFLRN